MSNQRPIHVVVTHAEPLVARGLAAVLSQQVDLQVHHAPLSSGEQIDVVVTDFRQGMQHAEAVRRGAVQGPLGQARVLVLGLSNREHDLRRAMEAGIQGFLVLGCALDEIATGVRALGMGTRYYDMGMVERMAESLTREPLTCRESEVLTRLVQGKCNKLIARDMRIALGTVKTHVKAILEKLDASSRTHAASIAMQRGLVDGDGDAPSEFAPLGLPFTPGLVSRQVAFAA